MQSRLRPSRALVAAGRLAIRPTANLPDEWNVWGNRLAMLSRALPAVAGVALVVIGFLAASQLENGATLETVLGLGYPGVALVMFISSSTVVLPAPGFLAVLGAGWVLNPMLVGIAGAVGSSLGELTGYLLGYTGRKALAPKGGRLLQVAEGWLRRYGFLTIVLFAAVPNPAFDIIGVVSGSLRYPPLRMWLATMIGNSIKYTAMAYLGGTAIGLLAHIGG